MINITKITNLQLPFEIEEGESIIVPQYNNYYDAGGWLTFLSVGAIQFPEGEQEPEPVVKTLEIDLAEALFGEAISRTLKVDFRSITFGGEVTKTLEIDLWSITFGEEASSSSSSLSSSSLSSSSVSSSSSSLSSSSSSLSSSSVSSSSSSLSSSSSSSSSSVSSSSSSSVSSSSSSVSSSSSSSVSSSSSSSVSSSSSSSVSSSSSSVSSSSSSTPPASSSSSSVSSSSSNSSSSSGISWLSGWSYRKKINITGQSGAGTNYPVKFFVGATSSATGEDFDLEGNSSIFPSGVNNSGDIRFTDYDGSTELDFYVEDVISSGSTAVAAIWVEISDDLNSDTYVYCYYGNSGASNASNGSNTFTWFDDFSDNSIDANYNVRGYNGWSEAGGILTYDGNTGDPNALTIDNITYDYDYEIRGKFRVRVWANNEQARIGFGMRTNTSGQGFKGLAHNNNGTLERAILHDGIAWNNSAAFTWSLNTWYHLAFYVVIGGSTRWLYEKDWADGALEPGSWTLTSTTTNTTAQGTQPCIAGASADATFEGDYNDVIVRKRIDTEPAFSLAGSEEAAWSSSSSSVSSSSSLSSSSLSSSSVSSSSSSLSSSSSSLSSSSVSSSSSSLSSSSSSLSSSSVSSSFSSSSISSSRSSLSSSSISSSLSSSSSSLSSSSSSRSSSSSLSSSSSSTFIGSSSSSSLSSSSSTFIKTYKFLTIMSKDDKTRFLTITDKNGEIRFLTN